MLQAASGGAGLGFAGAAPSTAPNQPEPEQSPSARAASGHLPRTGLRSPFPRVGEQSSHSARPEHQELFIDTGGALGELGERRAPCHAPLA